MAKTARAPADRLPISQRIDSKMESNPLRRKMQRSFRPRGETGYYQFDRPDYGCQYVLPKRFMGVI